jgi:hypothetical protein
MMNEISKQARIDAALEMVSTVYLTKYKNFVNPELPDRKPFFLTLCAQDALALVDAVIAEGKK